MSLTFGRVHSAAAALTLSQTTKEILNGYAGDSLSASIVQISRMAAFVIL
jgi:hypothetical protein